MELKSRNLIWILFVALFFLIFVTVKEVEGKGKVCPGRCMGNVTECKTKGGKIAGYCTNELPCCDYTFRKIGSCGAVKSKLATAIFRSPDYPEFSKGDLTCSFEFAFSPNASAVTVEFTHVVMDGVGFLKESPCESDMFLFKGFPDWTPPAQCGNLTNYVAVIDLGNKMTIGMRSLKIMALMSSRRYRWSVKVSQIFLKKRKKILTTTTVSPTEEDGGNNNDNPDDDAEDLPPDDYEKMSMEPLGMDFSEDPEVEKIVEEEEAVGILGSSVPRVKAYYHGSNQAVEKVDWIWPEDDLSGLEEEPLIVNGDLVNVSSTPWQASLRTIVTPYLAKQLKSTIKNCTISEGIHFCGGSVVSDRHILSAAHCFYMGEKFRTWQNLHRVKIVLGDSNLCDESTDGVQEFHVDKVYYHYAYDHKVIMHDVVVIKLNKKIKFSNKVQPIKLAEEGQTFKHVDALASGWGLTNLTIGQQADIPDQLRSADDMFIGNITECTEIQQKLYPTLEDKFTSRFPKYRNVFDSLLCTYVQNGSTPKVVGQGDSGGGLTFKLPAEGKEDADPFLIGVISYMIPIENDEMKHDVSNYMDFYQSVSFYRKWIDAAMYQK